MPFDCSSSCSLLFYYFSYTGMWEIYKNRFHFKGMCYLQVDCNDRHTCINLSVTL